jgi:hypothetical protein
VEDFFAIFRSKPLKDIHKCMNDPHKVALNQFVVRTFSGQETVLRGLKAQSEASQIDY